MAVANGFGKVVTSGSVFMYDTGDTYNSYIGEPTTNLYTTLGFGFYQQEGNHTAARTVGPAPNLNLPSNYDYTTITTTGNWQAEVNRIIIWTNTSLTSGTYNISFWARVTSTSTATMGCAFYGNNINNTMSLTNQWQRFSIQSTTHPLYRATEFGSLSGAITFQIAGLQIESVSHATQYVNGVRSATQGLLPLINNPTIDLSSVSFDSNAQMIWDGTDDTISINSYPAIELADNVSIEYVYMRLSTDPVLDVIANKYHSTGWELFCQTGATFALAGRNGDGTYYATSNAAYTIQNNQYYHLVAIKDGLSWRLYVNGALYASLTANTIGTWSNNGILQIGGEGAGYYPNMKLPIFKIYNSALSADQVKQNYQQYKTRFNLS